MTWSVRANPVPSRFRRRGEACGSTQIMRALANTEGPPDRTAPLPSPKRWKDNRYGVWSRATAAKRSGIVRHPVTRRLSKLTGRDSFAARSRAKWSAHTAFGLPARAPSGRQIFYQSSRELPQYTTGSGGGPSVRERRAAGIDQVDEVQHATGFLRIASGPLSRPEVQEGRTLRQVNARIGTGIARCRCHHFQVTFCGPLRNPCTRTIILLRKIDLA